MYKSGSKFNTDKSHKVSWEKYSYPIPFLLPKTVCTNEIASW